MNTLLIFFALPIATIIIAAVLEKILKCPLAVAALIFAIYLIVTFAAFDVTFLIATIVYTILAYITALIVRFIKRLFCCKNEENCESLCERLLDAIEILNANNNANTNSNNNCNCRYRRY